MILLATVKLEKKKRKKKREEKKRKKVRKKESHSKKCLSLFLHVAILVNSRIKISFAGFSKRLFLCEKTLCFLNTPSCKLENRGKKKLVSK